MSDVRYPVGPFHAPSVFTPELRGELIAQIEGTPASLRSAVSGMTEGQLRQPYRDEGWTVAQVVHHVADSHVNSYVRFKLAATEDNPPIKSYNEALWAELADATSLDLRASLGLLDALHARWVAFLRSLDDDQFSRTFNHSVTGPVSIDRALALYAWHGRHHTAHITTLREHMGW
jgi:uncharacterized damage-inducible protein DinB